MNRARLAALFQTFAAVAVASVAALCFACMAVNAQAISSNPSLDAYRTHLGQLLAIVVDCQQQHTPAACDSARVGADDQVKLTTAGGSVERRIRYDWLRTLLTRAGGKDESNNLPAMAGAPLAKPKSQPIEVQLQEAQERLGADARQAGGELTVATSGYPSEHQALTSILAAKEYKLIKHTTLRERATEWVLKWLDRILDKLIGAGMHFPWLARAIRAAFLAGICFVLIWLLVRIERRSRIRSLTDSGPGSSAPSARDWQLWLADARRMAEKSAWRDAIHFLYWAVISRLEARHVWPADRARTPREYLRLLSNDDARKQHLRLLTRSFENTWYGGRHADVADYDAAMRVAEELGVK